MKFSISLKRYLSLKLVGHIGSGNDLVYVYEDFYGVCWIKKSRWSLFLYKI